MIDRYSEEVEVKDSLYLFFAFIYASEYLK